MWKYFKKYRGFARCAISSKLNYRGVLLLNMVTNSVSIIASLFLWNTLFKEQSMISGYTWNDMILYVMIAFVMNATLGYSTESKLSGAVLDGSIVMELIKPLDFQNRCLFETMGSSLVEGLLALIIATIAALFMCNLGDYITAERCILLLSSLLLAFMVKFCISYLVGLCCFFTSNGFGILYLRQVITDIFSGALLPISFYPQWFQNIANVLPFQSIVYTPAQLFLGRLTGQDAINVMLLQLVWVIVLWVFGYFFFRFAIRKVTIQGG